ncbi:MAG: hypothetical protein M1311_05255 [Thaumarchaeota archaeon]|nr:hypothetical protein [Nitrososphaerota archaeon]MDG6921341.1 hypothetical protein [Nitrososphaerota archaeon]
MVHTKLRILPDAIDAVFVLGILWVIGKSFLTSSFIYSENTLAATIIASLLAYLIVSRRLRSKGLSFERVLLALSAVVGGIWLYEILYHYAYVSTISAIFDNLTTLNINTGMGTYFPLPWAIVMVAMSLVGFRYMRLNKGFYLCVLLTAVAFAIWVAIGYPQWLYPGSYFGTPIIRISSESTVFYGFLMNSITKFTVILIPATLYR